MKTMIGVLAVVSTVLAGCNNPDPYPRYGAGYTGPAATFYQTSAETPRNSYANFNEFDRSLVNRVREAIRENPELKGVEPSLVIASENGTVTLNGIVASKAESDSVEARARSAAGVANVVNYLETTPVTAVQISPTATGSSENP